MQPKCHKLPKLSLLSAIENNKEANGNVFGIFLQIAPRVPVIVLSYNNDVEMAKAATSRRAKGYIPVTLGFDIAIEAVRFVLAGGTYVSIDYLLTRTWPGNLPSEAVPASGAVTARELAVVRAIQQGKSNKVIAYELGMCESTVKVHVRSIMKKLNAKNRTDVAIKSSELLKCSRCTMQRECWSVGYCEQRAIREASKSLPRLCCDQRRTAGNCAGPDPSLDEIAEAIRVNGVTTLWLTAGLFHLMVESRLDGLQPSAPTDRRR